MVKNYITR